MRVFAGTRVRRGAGQGLLAHGQAALCHLAAFRAERVVVSCEAAEPFVNMLPVGVVFALLGTMLVAGIWLFNKTRNVSDELCEPQVGDRYLI